MSDRCPARRVHIPGRGTDPGKERLRASGATAIAAMWATYNGMRCLLTAQLESRTAVS